MSAIYGVMDSRRKPCENVPTNKHTSQVGDYTIEDNFEVVGERSRDRKSEKEREKKRKS